MYQILGGVSGYLLMMGLLAAAMPDLAYSQATESTNAATTQQLLDISWGMQVKLVWARAASPVTGSPHDNLGPGHVLVVFDTQEGRERVLQSTPGAYDHPFITRDGTRVIWSDMANAESWICNWDGSGTTLLLKGNNSSAPGRVAACRWDAVQEKEFVYAGVSVDANNNWGCVSQPKVYSYPLTGLSLDVDRQEVVWDAAIAGSGLCCMSYFGVSADGRFAAGEMSGGTNCLGLIDLENQQIVESRSPDAGSLGCMPNGAPDNSRRWFHAMAGHHYLHMYTYGEGSTTIYVSPDALYPGMGAWAISGFERMRWSNHARFITGGASMAFSGSSSDSSCCNYQFYLERFDSTFTGIEQIVQVSHAPIGYPSLNGDAWFDQDGANTPAEYPVPAIRNRDRSVGRSSAYDIQGRRIAPPKVRQQSASGMRPRGLRITDGRLQVTAD